MKSMKKVLASVLALAMVVTAVPVTNANAASTAKLNKTKASVYATKSTTLKVTTPSTWKSVKVTASSNKKTVATVKVSKKKITVKGVKAGTAKVTVKVTAKNQKAKTLKATITVKPVAIAAVETEKTVAVNETVKDLFTVKPAGKKLAYKSSDETVATVDANGVVTAVKAGEATITASSKYAKEAATVKVVVKNVVLKSVKQTKANTVEAVIAGNTSAIKATDIKITNTSNNNVVAVKEVNVDKADSTKVTLVTFADMTDGKIYTVTLENASADFTATDAVVADVNVTPLQITANTDGTEIKGQTLDKNGVVIKEFNNKNIPAGVDFSFSSTQGYANGERLVLPVVGNKGTAEITYHTYKFDDQTNEIGAIKKTFEITAVEAAAVITNGFKVTLADKTPNWEKDTLNNKISASDKNVKAYFEFKNSDNKEIKNYSDYSVISSDDTVLLLPKTALTDSKTGVQIFGIKAGSAYINVLDKDGKVVTSLPVVVTADRKLTNVTFGSTALVVANNASDATIETSVKAVDQYGADFKNIKSVTAVVKNPAGTGKTNLSQANTSAIDKVVLDATNVEPGTYTVAVEVVATDDTKVTRTISVKVVKASVTDPADAKDLRLGLSAKDVDLAIGADASEDDVLKKNVAVTVDAYSDGAKIGTVAVTDVKVNGKTDVVSGSSINLVTVDNGKVKKNLAAGTYTVTAKANGKDFTGTLVVKDTQSDNVVAKVEKKETAVTVANTMVDADVASVVAECVKFSINGADYATIDSSKITTTGSYKVNGSSVYVGTVKVAVETAKDVTYDVNVVINTTFTK